MLPTMTETDHKCVLIATGTTILPGLLVIPPGAVGIVILANGLGRMQQPAAEAFAERSQEAGLATLMVDLLTPDELQFDSRTAHFSSDAKFLSERLLEVVDWIHENPTTRDLPIVGAAAGAAARGLLRAAGDQRDSFKALVIDGNVRPTDVPAAIDIATLLLVEDDPVEIRRAQNVMEIFAGPTQLRILSPSDAVGGCAPFFSAAAGSMTAQWLSGSLRPFRVV